MTDRLNNTTFCETIDKLLRRYSRLISEISTPLNRIWPSVGLKNPDISFIIVDFPLPFVPMIAVRRSGWILKETLSRIFLRSSPVAAPARAAYSNDTFLNSISPVIGISVSFPSSFLSTISFRIFASFSVILPYSEITPILRNDAVLIYFTKNNIMKISLIVTLLSIFRLLYKIRMTYT